MYIFICNPITMIEKKVLTTTTTTTSIGTDFNLPFLPVFAILFNIFLATMDWSYIIEKIVPRLKSSLLSKFVHVHSKLGADNSLDCCANGGFDHDDHKHNDDDDDDDEDSIKTKDVEMVMERLGLFSSPESEGLGESFGCDELSRLFDEKEPSLEELKETFDVFDENRDGSIDAKELQRVLRMLGLKKQTEIQDCQRMIRTADVNQDGRVDFNEFVKFMENIFC